MAVGCGHMTDGVLNNDQDNYVGRVECWVFDAFGRLRGVLCSGTFGVIEQ